MEITTKTLLIVTRELIEAGYNPNHYLDLWLVGDELSMPKDPIQWNFHPLPIGE